MEELVDQGKVRAIGISNYSSKKLRDLLGYCRIKPAVYQGEVRGRRPESSGLKASLTSAGQHQCTTRIARTSICMLMMQSQPWCARQWPDVMPCAALRAGTQQSAGTTVLPATGCCSQQLLVRNAASLRSTAQRRHTQHGGMTQSLTSASRRC